MTSGSLAHPARSGSSLIVDSWLVLEWMLNKQAKATFGELLREATIGSCALPMSRLTRGEIAYSVVRKFGADRASDYMAVLDGFPIALPSVDDDSVDEAAAIKAKYPIAYADCFVAALAIRHRAPVITGDPDFLKLQERGLLTVRWLGA